MTVQELGKQYRFSADLLSPRIRQLRTQEKREPDPEKAYKLWRRIVTLESIRRQDLEVALELEQYGREVRR